MSTLMKDPESSFGGRFLRQSVQNPCSEKNLSGETMNFEFGEDQNLLRDQARGFLTDNCPPAVVRRVLEGEELYAEDLWQKIAEMGWTAVVIPEEYGGLGLSYLELVVVAEELG